MVFILWDASSLGILMDISLNTYLLLEVGCFLGVDLVVERVLSVYILNIVPPAFLKGKGHLCINQWNREAFISLCLWYTEIVSLLHL